jgi:hypothetical protein
MIQAALHFFDGRVKDNGAAGHQRGSNLGRLLRLHC